MAIGGIRKEGAKRATPVRVHLIRGRQWSVMAGEVLSVTKLRRLGQCMVKILSDSSKEYFVRRKWSGKDPMGGPEIWNSFSFKIVNGLDVEIRSTFYGMRELAHGSIPGRRMEWLTQEYKDKNPNKFELTPREKKLGLHKASKKRMPLIVPVKTNAGVEFRMAPLKIGDAWVHHGIAKFTFFETAIRKGRKACLEILKRRD